MTWSFWWLSSPGRSNACGCRPLGASSEGRDSSTRSTVSWEKNENTVFQLLFSCDLYTSCQSQRTVSKKLIEVQVRLLKWDSMGFNHYFDGDTADSRCNDAPGVWSHWNARTGSSSWGDGVRLYPKHLDNNITRIRSHTYLWNQLYQYEYSISIMIWNQLYQYEYSISIIVFEYQPWYEINYITMNIQYYSISLKIFQSQS